LGAPASRDGPLKREGDGRSPAGVFALGAAHGYAPASELRLHVPYAQATPAHHCVDDPRSAHYNRIVSSAEVATDWRSSERMRRDDDGYELAIEIEHNHTPVTAAHGSCIFLHVWAGPDRPVLGCTALASEPLHEIARWLRPNAAVLVALPRAEHRALQRTWGLP
jgi:D-alanyl-D-alanine dipeptidase